MDRAAIATFASALLTLALAASACTLILGDDFELASGAAPGAGGQAGAQGGGGSAGGSCGNGRVDDAEQCDSAGPSASCDADCTKAACGDGTLNPLAGEECDDGNAEDGDACDKVCKLASFEVAKASENADLSFVAFQPGVGLTSQEGKELFVVAWVQARPGDGVNEVRARPYRADGSAASPAAHVLSSAPGPAAARVASNPDGRSLVAWYRSLGQGGEIRYRVLDPGGAPAPGGEQLVPGSDCAVLPEVAAASTGELCVMWLQKPDTASVYCLDASGQPGDGGAQALGAAYLYGGAGVFGAYAIWPSGDGFIAAWYDKDTHRLTGRKLGPTGKPAAPAFEMSSLPDGRLLGTGLGSAPQASFTVAFTAHGEHGHPGDPRARFLLRSFAAPGDAATDETFVSETHEDETCPHLIGAQGERFLAVWSSGAEGTSGVRARRFGADAKPLGASFDVASAQPDHISLFARGAAGKAGDVMIAWGSAHLAAEDPEHGVAIRAVVFPGMLAEK